MTERRSSSPVAFCAARPFNGLGDPLRRLLAETGGLRGPCGMPVLRGKRVALVKAGEGRIGLSVSYGSSIADSVGGVEVSLVLLRGVGETGQLRKPESRSSKIDGVVGSLNELVNTSESGCGFP
jgi:hypothetical protein